MSPVLRPHLRSPSDVRPGNATRLRSPQAPGSAERLSSVLAGAAWIVEGDLGVLLSYAVCVGITASRRAVVPSYPSSKPAGLKTACAGIKNPLWKYPGIDRNTSDLVGAGLLGVFLVFLPLI